MAQPSSGATPTGAAVSTTIVTAQQVKELSSEALQKLANIDKNLAEFRAIPKANNDQEIVINRAKQYPLLAEAYKECRSLILAHPAGEPLHPEVSRRLFHVLGEHALYRYGDTTAVDKYKVSLQLGFGALAALLHHTRQSESCGDFSQPFMEDTAHLDKEIVTHTPFAFIEPLFRNLDTQVCFQKIIDQHLTPEDIVLAGKCLRHLSGAWRGLRGQRADTTRTQSDNEITIKTLTLEEKLLDYYIARIERENEPAKLALLKQERVSLRYNDGTDLIAARGLSEAEQEAETKKLLAWLTNPEQLASKQDVIWNLNKFSEELSKFFGDNEVDIMRKALSMGQELIEHYLSPEEREAFREVLKGNITDFNKILSMANLLVQKVKNDPGFELDLARYTMIPKNLADLLVNAKSPNQAEIVALYRFSTALSQVYVSSIYYHLVPYWSFNESLKVLNKFAVDLKSESEMLVKLATEALPKPHDLPAAQTASTPETAAQALEGICERIMKMNEPELSTRAVEINGVDFSSVATLLNQAHNKADKALDLLVAHEQFVLPEKLQEQTKAKLQVTVSSVQGISMIIRKLIKDIAATRANFDTLMQAKEAFAKRKQELASKPV